MPENATQRRRVLFVDDDTEFLRMIEPVMRFKSKDSWEILTASSASAALAILQEQPIHVAVIDISMPVVDGLQFLSIAQKRHPNLQKAILTGSATESYRKACLSQGADLFLEKPASAEGWDGIYAALDGLARWTPEPGFRGVLRRVGLMDVIQMECLNRASSLVTVTAGRSEGRIYIREGAVVHAAMDNLTGEEAFFRLLGFESGDFRHDPFVEPSEETIHAQWESLLMDAAQRRDETAGAHTKSEAGAPLPEPEPAFADFPREVAPPEPLRVDELTICSASGDVLHAWQCPSTDLRTKFIEFIADKARQMRQTLPLGDFERVEFHGTNERLAIHLSATAGVILRTSNVKAGESGIHASVNAKFYGANITPAQKAAAEGWFHDHLQVAGLLAAGLQFTDRTGRGHAISPTFPPHALDALRRGMSDTFQVLSLQRFAADRAAWTFDQTIVECVRRPDGTLLVLVLSRQTFDLDDRPVRRLIEAFEASGPTTMPEAF